MTLNVNVNIGVGQQYLAHVTTVDSYEGQEDVTTDYGHLMPGASVDVCIHDTRKLVIEESHLDLKECISEAPSIEGGIVHACLGFGAVIEGLKLGHRFARHGWNGKDMFIFLVHGSNFKVNRPPLSYIFEEGTEIDYNAHIDIKNVDGSISVWAPSVNDSLANDWHVVEV